MVEVAECAYNEWNKARVGAEGQRQINKVFKMEELCKAVKAVADSAPTVDAIQVIRCENCNKVIPEINAAKPGSIRRCSLWDRFVRYDDYCSQAQRKNK